jgi:hypothetical protein
MRTNTALASRPEAEHHQHWRIQADSQPSYAALAPQSGSTRRQPSRINGLQAPQAANRERWAKARAMLEAQYGRGSALVLNRPQRW